MNLSQRAAYLSFGLFLFAMLVLLFVGQTKTVPTEPREKRLFEMVKNMRATGDYLVPRLKGEPHVNKPPFYPWLAVASNAGDVLPGFVANRLPSILAALAILSGMFFFCRAAGVPQLALPSVLLLALCKTYLSEARIANFDILLTAFCFAANAFFWFYIRDRRILLFLLTGLGFTLAFFTKVTPVYAMVLVPWVILCWMEWQRARQEVPPRPLKIPILSIATIVILGSAVGLVWFAAIWNMVPEGKKIIVEAATLPFGGAKNPNALVRFFLQYVPADALGGESKEKFALHYKPFLFFFEHLPGIIFPATLFLPFLIGRVWRTRGYQGMPLQRWMGVSFLVVFLIFSLLKQKQEAYLLPMLPFVCILLADALVAFLAGAQEKIGVVCKWEMGWMKFLGYAFSVVGFVSVIAIFLYFHTVVPRPLWMVICPLIFAALGVLILRFTWRGEFVRMLLAAFTVFWLLQMVYSGSLHVWRSLIDTNQYQQESTVSPDHWEKLFAKHPFLKGAFKYPPEDAKKSASKADEE